MRVTVFDLTVVAGQLSDRDAVEQAVSGADAVISALGPSLKRSTTGTQVTDGTRGIVRAMERQHVSRFVGLATPSLAGLMFPNALAEMKGMTAAVTASDLDYTIARRRLLLRQHPTPARRQPRSHRPGAAQRTGGHQAGGPGRPGLLRSGRAPLPWSTPPRPPRTGSSSAQRSPSCRPTTRSASSSSSRPRRPSPPGASNWSPDAARRRSRSRCSTTTSTTTTCCTPPNSTC
ncbi:MAG: SDR family oxidoreductase [Streptomyces sp.]|nr:SDR family oxidoreductase [Streptomyces sp.]